jgi:hypothetical protein
MHRNRRSWTVSHLAWCCDCSEEFAAVEADAEGYDSATTWARKHHDKTGHRTHTERAVVTYYG